MKLMFDRGFSGRSLFPAGLTVSFGPPKGQLCGRRYPMGVFKLALLQFFLFSGLLHAAGQTDTDQNLYGKTVREIRIVQLQHTDRDIVTRELVSQVGDPYLQENTQKDLERLDRLGIFSESGETTWMTSMRRPPILPFFPR